LFLVWKGRDKGAVDDRRSSESTIVETRDGDQY
jgi:hypothetical protein